MPNVSTAIAVARTRSNRACDPFTIWTLSARFPLRVKSSDSRFARDGPAGEGGGGQQRHRGMPDTTRSSGARRWLRGFILAGASCAAAPAWAEQPPKLVLHEFVQEATRSIDRHEVAALVLFAGLLLFAVVTAILLLRTRARLVRLEASAHDDVAALRSDLDRANALLLSEPQVMVDWPAASDEPTIEGDPALVGAAAP